MGSQFVLKNFKWDRAGYQALQNSSAIQSMCRSVAESTASAANASVSADGMDNPAFSVFEWDGKLAHGYGVVTSNPHGYNAQAKKKVLTKALRGAGGQ